MLWDKAQRLEKYGKCGDRKDSVAEEQLAAMMAKSFPELRTAICVMKPSKFPSSIYKYLYVMMINIAGR